MYAVGPRENWADQPQGSRLQVIYSNQMKKLVYLLPVLLIAATISLRSPTPSPTGIPMSTREGSPPASIRPVRWVLVESGRAREVTPGRATPLTLEAQIAKGWHIYALAQKPGGPIPLTIRLIGSEDAVIRGLIKAPQPETQFDNNFGIETELYSGTPRFTIQVAVPSRARSGARKIQVGARYQVCSETLCLPPRTDTVRAVLRVGKRS
jgi:DsbC/DsbD-like thiol-disulfide interchange protein